VSKPAIWAGLPHFVVRSADRGPRTPWEKARGDRGYRLHDLGASWVTNPANAGVPSIQAKEWTGHAGLEIHDRYNVVSRAALAVVSDTYATALSAE
jgi:hypothetical protein